MRSEKEKRLAQAAPKKRKRKGGEVRQMMQRSFPIEKEKWHRNGGTPEKKRRAIVKKTLKARDRCRRRKKTRVR